MSFKILLHIMCLNVTWFNSSWTDLELQIEGYNLIQNDRPDSPMWWWDCYLFYLSPPNNDLEVFKINIEEVLDKISTERANVILAGDLNEDMKGKRLTSQAKCLIQLFNIYQLKQLIKEPTRKTGHTSSLIDLVYTVIRGRENHC